MINAPAKVQTEIRRETDVRKETMAWTLPNRQLELTCPESLLDLGMARNNA